MVQGNTSIVVAGKKFDAGCRVILWNEEAGLSFYAVGKGYTPHQHNYEQLQDRIKSLYIHHTATFRAHSTFIGLQARGYSTVFLVDDDYNEDTGCATIYQCLDVKEAAYTQGGVHNHDGSGIEICYYPDAWTVPDRYSAFNRKRFGLPKHPVKEDTIHGHHFKKCYGPTDAQVKACLFLAKAYLTAFPKLQPEFPKDQDGNILTTVVPNEMRKNLLHHFHIKREKVDAMGFPSKSFENQLQFAMKDKPIILNRSFWQRLSAWVNK